MLDTSVDGGDTDVNLADYVLPLWYQILVEEPGSEHANKSVCEVLSHSGNAMKKIKEQPMLSLSFYGVLSPKAILCT